MLIVDDNTAMRLSLADALASMKYHVMVAANGQEALSLLAAYGAEVSVVLSDVSMPVMDGLTLARMLREQEWRKPIILMSSDHRSQHLQGMDAQLFNIWLRKPFGLPELAQVLDDLLRQ